MKLTPIDTICPARRLNLSLMLAANLGPDPNPQFQARTHFQAIVSTARPKQWIKNVLVFAAPGAAGVLSHGTKLSQSVATFLLFCAMASGVYFLNDSLDAAADRLHHTKRFRPVANGELSVSLATTIGVVLIIVSLLAGSIFVTPRLLFVMGTYVVINISYCLWLKHEPVVDMVAVASGFALRAIAGGIATGVILSDWFLIVTMSGSLFMVAGKRHAEHVDLGVERASHRSTLSQYSLAYLRYVRAVSSGVTLTAYCLWAFEKAAHPGDQSIFFRLSIVPFLIIVLRYALILDTGKGGAPEEIVLGDRRLQITGLIWLAVFLLGVYWPGPR